MPKKTYEQLVLENKKIKELMTHTSETMRKACDDRYDLQKENEMLRDLLQNRIPVGCIAETTYQPVLAENESLKEKIDELKAELQLKIDCYSKLYHEFDAEHNRLLDERVKFSEYLSKVSKALGIEWHGEYQDIINKAHSLRQEKKSAKLSNAQKTKVIHKLRKELKETYNELKVENNDIQEEFDRYRFDYFFAEKCCFCNIDLTWDDYQLSLDAGKWCCEEHYEEALEERSTDADKLREKFGKELDEKNEKIAELCKKLAKQREEKTPLIK